MTTATMRLLDAIRSSHGNCTDYRAGKLLRVSTACVSRWRVGKSHMSMANVSKACELAGIPEQTWEWQIRIGAEREQGPDGDVYREALKDLEAVQAGAEPSPIGFIAMARRASHAAIILIGIATGATALAPMKQAVSAPLDAGALRGDCILWKIAGAWRKRRRRTPRQLKFFTWFPIAQGAAA